MAARAPTAADFAVPIIESPPTPMAESRPARDRLCRHYAIADNYPDG
jgi:hypothetical protein